MNGAKQNVFQLPNWIENVFTRLQCLANIFKSKLVCVGRDRRTQSAKKKIDYDSVDAHIESIQPFISHYRREHAPNRRYLRSDISISVMFETFESQYPDMKVSYEAYRLRVKAKNISFASLGHEECEQCEEFNLPGHQKQDLQKNAKNVLLGRSTLITPETLESYTKNTLEMSSKMVLLVFL
ncbi:hypothetical protein JTB14_024287 [Gonioctena quinquepunctata]|nr:hypothetical protein JTB14_024287 [Gonioctena quinquepunctata]